MNKFSVLVLALVVALAAVGCDSAEDDPSDAERFVGTWTMVGLSDGDGDKMTDFNQVADGLTANLSADGQIVINVDYKEGTGLQDRTIPGTYEVNEGAKVLVVNPPTGQSISFQYEFDSNTRATLSAASQFINALFGTEAYTGTVTITIEK